MTKRKQTKVQTIICKRRHRKQNIQKHEPHLMGRQRIGLISGVPKGCIVTIPVVAPVMLLINGMPIIINTNMNLYQTNRRKDEPNIVFVTRKWQWTLQNKTCEDIYIKRTQCTFRNTRTTGGELECSVNDVYKVSISDMSYFMTNCFVFMYGEETCLHDCGYMI